MGKKWRMGWSAFSEGGVPAPTCRAVAIAKAEALCDGGFAAHHKQLDKSIRAIYKKYIVIYKKYMESCHG
jgi:hypothetical protein